MPARAQLTISSSPPLMSSWLDTKEMSVMTGARLSSQLWYNIVIPRLEAEAPATPVTCEPPDTEPNDKTSSQLGLFLVIGIGYWATHIFCIFIYLLSFTNTIEQVYHSVSNQIIFSHIETSSECSARCGVHSLSTDWVLMFAKSWHKSRDSWPRLCREGQGSKPRPVWLVRSDDDSWPDPSGPEFHCWPMNPEYQGPARGDVMLRPGPGITDFMVMFGCLY